MRFKDFIKDQKIFKAADCVDKPSVSVIMPTYCRAQSGLLSRAINSVLDQKYSDFEFIIVDDGSSDGSEEIIRDFMKRDSRIIYVRHDINSGLPALRVDEGMLLGRGKYFAFQFDDDEWFPDFLNIVIKFAEEGKFKFVHSQAEIVVDGRVSNPRFPVNQPTYNSLLQGNKIANNSVILSHDLIKMGGLYNPHVVIKRTTDWDLWLRLSKKVPPRMVDKVLVRCHSSLIDSVGMTAGAWNQVSDLDDVLKITENRDFNYENMQEYDVDSLSDYSQIINRDILDKYQHNLVIPWLKQHLDELGKEGLLTQKEIDNYFIDMTPLVDQQARFRLKKVKAIIHLIKAAINNRMPVKKYFWEKLPSEFYIIGEDAIISGYRINNYKLQLSKNLQYTEYLDYRINIVNGSLSSMLIPFIINKEILRGKILVEIFSKENIINGGIVLPAFCIKKDAPVELYFEPPVKEGEYQIKIGGRGLNASVFILELAGGKDNSLTAGKYPFCKLILK